MTFDDPVLLSVTFGQTSVGKRAVALWRRVLDFDGDGYSALLGGGDCDDSNPRVSSLLPEICGDMVDNNCNGLVDDREPGGCMRPPYDRTMR